MKVKEFIGTTIDPNSWIIHQNYWFDGFAIKPVNPTVYNKTVRFVDVAAKTIYIGAIRRTYKPRRSPNAY